MMRRQRGFTLIELIVVVAMVSIMLSLAVPSFRSFISNYRITTAVNDFLQAVTVTRAEAIKTGKRVVMLPSDSSGCPSATGSWTNGWTIFVDNNRNFAYDSSAVLSSVAPRLPCSTGSDTTVFNHGALPSSISSAAAGGGSAQAFTFAETIGTITYVSFDGTGYPRRQDGSVLTGGIVFSDTLVSPANKRTLCLAILGRPRIVQAVDNCVSG